MGFIKDLLIKSKLIVAETGTVTVSTEKKSAKREKTVVITLQDLEKKTKDIKPETFSQIFEGIGDFFLKPEEIYQEARLHPLKNNWTILRLLDVGKGLEHQKIDPENIKKLLLAQLDTDKVKIEDLFKDAHLRDMSLDIFEDLLLKKINEKKCLLEGKIIDLKKEKEKIEKEIEIASLETNELSKKHENWKKLKKEEEKKMEEAVKFLSMEKIITINEG